jgi:large subunit ribosomal protein L1
MSKHGKRYEEARKLVDRAKIYTPTEACELIKQTCYGKFDATVDVHMKMGVDPRHADQQVRSVVLLPNGTGKKVRIMVFAEADAARAAMEAGADFVGSDDYVQKIQGGWMEFDVAVATPQIMGKVGRLGKVLGPRGLMPSPKTGTIVPGEDMPRLIRELRLGRVEFRVDKTANIHVPIGKVSFTKEQLYENFAALMEAVVKAKPSGAKGQYVRKVVLSATMSPGIKIDNVQAELLRVG